MSRVIHFELPSDNPDNAVRFYESVFGWKFTKWEGPTEYWLISTGDAAVPGIDGGLLRRPHPGAGTVNTVGVASLDEAVAKVESAGGKIAVPKMPIPGAGWLAYAVDPDGNTFGMMQNDPSAA